MTEDPRDEAERSLANALQALVAGYRAEVAIGALIRCTSACIVAATKDQREADQVTGMVYQSSKRETRRIWKWVKEQAAEQAIGEPRGHA